MTRSPRGCAIANNDRSRATLNDRCSAACLLGSTTKYVFKARESVQDRLEGVIGFRVRAEQSSQLHEQQRENQQIGRTGKADLLESKPVSGQHDCQQGRGVVRDSGEYLRNGQ